MRIRFSTRRNSRAYGIRLGRGLIWIDCDMMAVGALEARDRRSHHADDKCRSAQTAMCRDDSGTVAEIIAGGLPMQPFLDAIEKDRISRESPYYNTGFIVCRSPTMMRAWNALGRTTPLHSLFDQNLFNLVLAEQGGPLELPAQVWNLQALFAGRSDAERYRRPHDLDGAREAALLLQPRRDEEIRRVGALDLGTADPPLPPNSAYARGPTRCTFSTSGLWGLFSSTASRADGTGGKC